MEFSRSDLNHAENLVRTLKRVKLEVEGLEVLALAEMMKWVGNLASVIKTEVENPKPEPQEPPPPTEEIKNKPQPKKNSRNDLAGAF